MRGFLKEHSGAFDPDEVHTLVAAFDKAWETVQASLDRRDQELLDKQMRRLVPPQNDGRKCCDACCCDVFSWHGPRQRPVCAPK
jgi:hypothetical protein